MIRVLFKVQSWKSRHSLAKQHEHFARGFGYATNIDGDIHLRLAVLLTLNAQWLTQWFIQWPHWTMARLFWNRKVRDDTHVVSKNKMLMAITRIHPHSWRFWTDWPLDQDREVGYSVFWLTPTFLTWMHSSVRIILNWFILSGFIYVTRN